MAKNHTKKGKHSDEASKYDLEVTTEADLPKLDAIMKKNPTIVLVYIGAEEWCGPCQQFRPMWNEYKKTKGRKIPMIHVDHKFVPKTPFSSAKIDGFPSNVIYSGKDKSFSSFKDDSGKETNSIPNIRDRGTMTSLLKTDPSKLLKNNTGTPDKDPFDTESPVPTPLARAKMAESGLRAIQNKDTPILDMNDPTPPNVTSDTIQRAENSVMNRVKALRGGSLFNTLLRAVKGLGPPTRSAKRTRRQRSNKTVKN